MRLWTRSKKGREPSEHDNLTNKICPECGKRLLLVNGKQGNFMFARIESAATKSVFPD